MRQHFLDEGQTGAQQTSRKDVRARRRNSAGFHKRDEKHVAD